MSTTVRCLGVALDGELSFAEHIKQLSNGCFYQLRQLCSLRRFLTKESAKTLVHATVLSQVDYCNSVLNRVCAVHLRLLQSVLRSAARLVLRVGKYDHISTEICDDLHWLPVDQRIEFKTCASVYKCLHGVAPVHAFADDLQVYGHAAQHEATLRATQMSSCIKSVKAWMSSNRLRLNPSKTELIWLGSSRRLQHCSSTGMRVSDVDLQPVDCVRDLGVLIDSGMTLARHVNHISGVCLFQLRQLRIIRCSLTSDAAHALVRALIHRPDVLSCANNSGERILICWGKVQLQG